MTKPDSVTTNDDAGTATPEELMMTDVAVLAAHVAAKPATLLLPGCTVGVEAAKNDVGKFKVIVPPCGSDVDKVKLKVTGTPIFAAIR